MPIPASTVADLVRARDWSATPLGPREAWTPSLQTALSICMESRFPILLWWGPELVMLYNDAYVPILGNKHPRALGQPGRECWPEIWDVIGPMLDGVVRMGSATWSEDQVLFLERHGFPEECYFTFSYSPVHEAGRVAGIFTAVTETTDRVLRERRQALLRSLVPGARTTGDAVTACVRALATDPRDVPFAVLALDGRPVEVTGLPDGARLASIARGLADSGAGQVLDDPGALLGLVPRSPWGDPVGRCIVHPLAIAGERAGVLLLGTNPRTRLDAATREFHDLVADRVLSVLADARVFEAERDRADQLARLDRAKTAFLANVSHELRTPLTLVLGPLERAAATPGLDDQARADIETALRSTQRLRRLVTNLLDFSRIEAGRLDATFGPTDAAALTREIAGMFEGVYATAGLRLEVEDEGLPGPVWLDRSLWERVLVNLLANSLKYTMDGGVTIRVRDAGDAALVEVADTGVGIRPEDRHRVFDRFTRLEQPLARTNEGTGIGLALTAELVRLHGGTIRAGATPGGGTTMAIRIPYGTAHLPADRVAAHADAPDLSTGPGSASASVLEEAAGWLGGAGPGSGAPAGFDRPDPPLPAGPFSTDLDPVLTGARIVIADDNADMRAYLASLFPASKVAAVSDGEAALVALARGADLLIADVMMPRLDGLALTRRVRDDPGLAGLPVILLSARAGEEAGNDGVAHGADDYLVKPFSAARLVGRARARVALARERRRADHELRAVEDHWRAELAREVALLDQVIAAAPVGIGVWDAGLRCRTMNQRLAQMHGLEPLAPGLWRDARSEAPPWDRHHEGLVAALAGEQRLGVEVAVRAGPGTAPRALLASYVPVRDPDGSVAAVELSCVDVTDDRRREMALREALGARDEFLGLVSHELRTPLTAMLGTARLLANRPPARWSPSHEALFADLAAEAERLNRIVENLLTLARLGQGADPEIDPVLIERVVRRAVAVQSRSAPTRPIILTCDDPSLVIMGHDGYVEQVIANFLSNADKYSPPGAPIELTCERVGTEAVISVADRGRGISPDEADVVFDAFYRSPRTAATAGIGIGLTVCRRLAEAQGGRVWAQPREGGGATFRLALPLSWEV